MAIPDNPKKDFSPFDGNLPPTKPVGRRDVGPAAGSTSASGSGAQGDLSPFNDRLPPTQPVGRKDVGPIPESTNPQGSTSGTQQAGGSASASATRTTEVSSSAGRQQSASSTSVSGRASDDLQKAVGQQLQKQGADVVYDDQSIDISAAAVKEVVREAPLIKERIHEETTVVDKTQIEKDVRKTVVQQVVQPIREKEQRSQDVKTIDKGREVREHGQAGLDQDTKAELERRKQEVAAKLQTERDHETKKVSERPDVIRNEQVKVVEQVIPVLEKDIYVPHRVEEEKYIKEIYNEKPVVKETIVEPTITRAEFEEKYGKVEASAASKTSSTSTTDLRANNVVSQKTSSSTSSSSNSGGNFNTAQDAQHKAKDLAEGAKAKAESTVDAAKSKASQAANKIEANNPDSRAGSDHYSMSSDGMARDAEADGGSSIGVADVLKAPFKAVANVAKKLVD
jgi:hypothetical protein